MITETRTFAFTRWPELELQLEDRGEGSPILLLPGLFNLEPGSVVVDELVKTNRVLLPTHPGSRGSKRPDWCDSVDDLVLVYLELIEQLGLSAVTVIGCSLGGWVAAELALRRPPWLDRLVLVDPVGIRAAKSPDERDIADVFFFHPDDVRARAFCEPALGEHYMGTIGKPVEHVQAIAREQECVAVYGWQPYLHNPKLLRRLEHINAETLVVWGAEDGIVTPDYGRIFAQAIPGARFTAVEQAAHMPHIERPTEFLALVRPFLSGNHIETGDAA